MRKTISYSSFLVASLILVLIFLTAKNYTQLGVGIVLYPALAYFALKLFPRRSTKEPVITIKMPELKLAKKSQQEAKPEGKPVEISDIDKRAFLKLIGAAGLSFFLFSLLRRKADVLFPGGNGSGSGATMLQDVSGNKIDPAQSQPMDGYRISEVDDNLISYYGFINKNGAWFIMREDADTGSFRYAKADSNFESNWKNREGLQYDYYHNIF